MPSLLQWLNPTRAALPLAVGFAILMAISTATVWLVEEAEGEAKWVAHSFQVQTTFNALLRFLRRAESAERGYLITHDDADLEVFRGGVEGVAAALAEARKLTADNTAQQTELDGLEPVLRARLGDMKELVADGSAADREHVMAVIRRGRALMVDIGQRVERMMASEQRLLEARTRALRETSRDLLMTTLLGALIIIGLATLAMVLVRRTTRELQSAQTQLAEANEGLEATVAERTADLLEANQEIQRFAYIVSHDLRAPLVNIMGFTTELEALRSDVFTRLAELRKATEAAAANDDQLGQDFDEAIGFIKASISKMDRLINAILRLSREGRREFTPESIDMKAVLQTIADSLAHQANEAEASITVGNLPSVRSDRLAVEQVFTNLIDNALKYSRPGVPGYIEVLGRETPRAAIYEVRDNGRGIDPKDRERVFELFRRSGRQDRPGEGIGLAHVRALVRRLGGTIVLSSEPGKGSIFTVTLPKQWAAEGKRKAA